MLEGVERGTFMLERVAPLPLSGVAAFPVLFVWTRTRRSPNRVGGVGLLRQDFKTPHPDRSGCATQLILHKRTLKNRRSKDRDLRYNSSRVSARTVNWQELCPWRYRRHGP